MKNIRLPGNLLIIILLFISSCRNEPCLDIAGLDKRVEEVKEWYVLDTIGNSTIIDTYGMSQTLKISSRNTHYSDDIIEDDCGNTYGSWYFSIQYNTSLSPINFMVDINGSGNDADGFYLKLTITNTKTVAHKSTTYDFVSERCRENNATVNYIDKITIFGKDYSEILEIEFNEALSTNDVKTVYYAKGYGIIMFKLLNGNMFKVK